MLKENADKIEFLLNARPNEEIPIFDVGAEISKDKLESMFGGGLESILPGLIEKSGMKFEF